MIKFFDLKAYNAQFKSEFESSFSKFLDSGRYILGENVSSFEKNFSDYCGTNYCVGIGNGLDALILIFKGYIHLGKLSPGDEVMVPANTFIASILAIIHSGLTPVFIEPDRQSYNISPDNIANAITSKTKAILAVHLYGQLADMDAINATAKAFDLLVIEDAAQAHGAKDNAGNYAGSLSDAAAFSFYPSKNLGALGDGGCITTNDEDLSRVTQKMRNYGTSSKYINDLKGQNTRLDEVQALFLNIKLKQLDEDNRKRCEIAKYYLKEVINPKIELPYYTGDHDHVFHQFVVRVDNREKFVEYLKLKGIETLIHYPVAPHHQKALSEYEHLHLPITDEIHKTVVSIPLNPILSEEEMNKIIECLNAY